MSETTNILNTNQTHLIIYKGKYIFYNEQSIAQYCFDKLFCYQPHNNWKCEINHFLSKDNSKQCYSQIKNDIITQFKTDIYFTVTKQIELSITCKSIIMNIIITNNSKIQNMKCKIDSHFFKYNPKILKYSNFYDSRIDLETISIKVLQYKSAIIVTITLLFIGIIIIYMFQNREEQNKDIKVELPYVFARYIRDPEHIYEDLTNL